MRQVRADGKICVLDTTAEGVERVKSSNLECKFLFIGPSSIEAYEARQRQRGQDTEEKLQIKVQQARDDVAFSSVPGRFDAILINDDKDVAFEELTYILQGWYPDIEDATSLAAVSAESSQA